MKKIAFLLTLGLTLPVAAGWTEGIGYFDKQQYSQAFSEFKPLADQGDRRAQYYVAYMYFNGFGVGRDDQMGLSYLKKSTDQEYEKAQALLGYLYSEGRIIPQDKIMATKLYEAAAESDDDDALLNLGVMYYLGDGIDRDVPRAIGYLERVNIVNKPIVGRYLGDIYQYQDTPDSRAKSRKSYLQSAAAGDIGSFHALAFMEQTGRDDDKNLDIAVKYYTYAASRGYAPSQYVLGAMYANGEGLPRNIITAYAWMTLSANQGLDVAIEGQKQLAKDLTLSEIEQARKKMIEIQTTVIGKVESPLNPTAVAAQTGEKPSKPAEQQRKKKSRRSGGRRR